jgi:succinate dehydrogenase / fumarate reductase cytochrome b subunit
VGRYAAFASQIATESSSPLAEERPHTTPLSEQESTAVDKPTASSGDESSFLSRHEFLLRRLHSLSGVLPVGAYMVVHLLTNATILDAEGTFQRQVNLIHNLPMLVVIEWVFIFLPLLYHAIYGILIVREGLPNHSTYRYGSNVRYTLQRATGMIAFVFIMWHVFHMHGWIHTEWWEKTVHGFGAMFRPYNAGSTAAEAMQANVLYPIFYAIGVLSCVYHLANGIWTFGITWGLWTTAAAQARALRVCAVFGVLLGFVGLSAIFGFSTADAKKLRVRENQIIKARIESGEIDPDSPKIYHEVHPETASK